MTSNLDRLICLLAFQDIEQSSLPLWFLVFAQSGIPVGWKLQSHQTWALKSKLQFLNHGKTQLSYLCFGSMIWCAPLHERSLKSKNLNLLYMSCKSKSVDQPPGKHVQKAHKKVNATEIHPFLTLMCARWTFLTKLMKVSKLQHVDHYIVGHSLIQWKTRNIWSKTLESAQSHQTFMRPFPDHTKKNVSPKKIWNDPFQIALYSWISYGVNFWVGETVQKVVAFPKVVKNKPIFSPILIKSINDTPRIKLMYPPSSAKRLSSGYETWLSFTAINCLK